MDTNCRLIIYFFKFILNICILYIVLYCLFKTIFVYLAYDVCIKMIQWYLYNTHKIYVIGEAKNTWKIKAYNCLSQILHHAYCH